MIPKRNKNIEYKTEKKEKLGKKENTTTENRRKSTRGREKERGSQGQVFIKKEEDRNNKTQNANKRQIQQE